MTAAEKCTSKGAKRKTTKKKAGLAVSISTALLAVLCAASVFLSRELEKRTYPLVHLDAVLAGAAEFEIEPALVAAVICCESSGRAEAVSHKGAVGLMQIMPSTGEWIAEKLALENYSEQQLKEPEINIRMGCWYLSYLLRKFDGNRVHALAAYNAGPGNVKKWLEDTAYSENGQLTVIPFKETAAYVKKVTAAEEKYRELYEKELG